MKPGNLRNLFRKVPNPAAVDRKMRVRRIETPRRRGAFFRLNQRKDGRYGQKIIYF